MHFEGPIQEQHAHFCFLKSLGYKSWDSLELYHSSWGPLLLMAEFSLLPMASSGPLHFWIYLIEFRSPLCVCIYYIHMYTYKLYTLRFMYIYTLSIHKILHTYFYYFCQWLLSMPFKGTHYLFHHFNSGIRITKCKL